MLYKKNETMRFIGSQVPCMLNEHAKHQIYDVVNAYTETNAMNFSNLLLLGTDLFVLGYIHGKRGSVDRIAEIKYQNKISNIRNDEVS